MISVIVPLYNYAGYIEENIVSIKEQSISDWEIIIVDDCSKDNPYAVIKKHLGSNIKYIRLDNNLGYGAAKNIGIRACAGEYIVVLDADDMLTKNSLEIRLNSLEKSGKKWIHAKALEFSGKPYNFRYKKRRSIRRLESILVTKNYKDLWRSIHAQTVMIHRDIYKFVGLYDPRLRSMGDKEMWARIINNVGIPYYLDEFVAYYRQHSKQMHRSKSKIKNLKKYEKILNRRIKQYRNGDLSGVEIL